MQVVYSDGKYRKSSGSNEVIVFRELKVLMKKRSKCSSCCLNREMLRLIMRARKLEYNLLTWKIARLKARGRTQTSLVSTLMLNNMRWIDFSALLMIVINGTLCLSKLSQGKHIIRYYY